MTPRSEKEDCYSALGLARTARLEEASLHRAYTARSRDAHPDHGGSEAMAAEVNAAYETLRSPEKRLKHLLEIAGPPEARAWRTVPLDESMMSLFSRLGGVMENTARFLERKSKAATALARALLTGEALLHREALEAIAADIQQRQAEMEEQLSSLDSALAGHDPAGWRQLAAIQARFAYLARWQAQVRERLLALM